MRAIRRAFMYRRCCPRGRCQECQLRRRRSALGPLPLRALEGGALALLCGRGSSKLAGQKPRLTRPFASLPTLFFSTPETVLA
eukprot:9445363-Pyramimonas_sp.AAC.1